MPIALQPDGVNLRYFKLTLLDLTEFTVCGKDSIIFFQKKLIYIFRFTMAGKNMLFIKNSKGKQIF